MGRMWSDAAGGPCPVLIRDGQVLDFVALCRPSRAFWNGLIWWLNRAAIFRRWAIWMGFWIRGAIRAIWDGCLPPAICRQSSWQAIKVAGVTFAGSMIERVIEERAKGDPSRRGDPR